MHSGRIGVGGPTLILARPDRDLPNPEVIRNGTESVIQVAKGHSENNNIVLLSPCQALLFCDLVTVTNMF